MPRSSDKRERLISAADNLIHKQGFHRTTLADIAEESGVPLGNVYYYFKTKEELCKAVIEERRQDLSSKLQDCCKAEQPKQALISLVKHIAKESDILAKEGCPMGSLCQELDPDYEELMHSADGCMTEMLHWATEQFKLMGVESPADMGFEFVSRMQGVIIIGNAMHDADKIRQQLNKICDWVKSVPTGCNTEELVDVVH